MADFIIEFGVAGAPGDYGGMPVMPCDCTVEHVLNPATATEATITGDGRSTVTITAKGGSGWVEFGAAPTVEIDTAPAIFLPEGATRSFGPLPKGWLMDFINDS